MQSFSIPAALRHKYAIRDGTRILVEDAGDRIVLRPVTDVMVRKLRGSLKGGGALQTLLEGRLAERKREA
ncbi:MAG: AbrB/MazE/SpoVT family DNA-binding domain-containing protein [Ardenticatenales bacterium]